MLCQRVEDNAFQPSVGFSERLPEWPRVFFAAKLRVRDARIEERDEKYFLKAETAGEPLDAARHHQRADVKAVTLHDFSVEKEDGGWKARVLLDI